MSTPTPHSAEAWSHAIQTLTDAVLTLERERNAAQSELAARERQLEICEAVVDQHADTILKLHAELARARDDEARECENLCQKVVDAYHPVDYSKYENQKGARMVHINAAIGANLCAVAIERRIAERGK